MTRIGLTSTIVGMCFLGMFFSAIGHAAQDIEIASMAPFTGSSAFFGPLMRNVGNGVVDDINKAGIKGFGKMKIRHYDTAADPAIAIQQVERAAMQGANIIWGAFLSAEEKAIAAKANELKIPYVMHNATSHEAFPRSGRYAMDQGLSPFDRGITVAEYFKKEGVKTYAVLGADILYGRILERSVMYGLKGSGIKKIYENWHELSKVDFSADIAKLKDLKPDALMKYFGGTGEYAVIKQVKDAGYWPKIYIGDNVAGCYQVLLDEVGEKYAVGVTTPSTQDPTNPKWIEFARTHEEKYGYRPTWLSDGMHDTLWRIKIAIEKAGTLEPEKLNKALHEVSFSGVGGYPLGPYQEWGGLQKGTIYLLKFVTGSPPWSKTIGVHREIVYKKDVTPLCKEDTEELLKDIK